ncbi:MAG: CHAD domain-containing protein [Proteobacteria bacterium]|nr:CHAD domain-containing protein [Pseudomonadota bacterium]
MSVLPDGSARLRRALRESQAALAVRLSRLHEANERDVHQCRVDCRRLRALLKSYRSFFSAEQVLRFRAALKRVADLLTEIRALDVLAALPPLQGEQTARELVSARQRAVKRLARRLASPSNQSALELSARGPRRGDLGLHAGITDADVLRRARRSWRRAQRLLEPRPRTRRELHELRISLKICRYVLEIVLDINPGDVAALRRRLRDAQRNLGDQRDAEAAADWLRSDPERAARGRVARQSLERRVNKLDRNLDPALARLARAGKRWDHAVTKLIERDLKGPA